MNHTSITCTIYFEAPFWVGMFERLEDNEQCVSKVTFGAEPKDYEVYAYVLYTMTTLRFSPKVEVQHKKRTLHPKRMQRQVKKEMAQCGVGTKSQQAFKLAVQQMQLERKTRKKAVKEAEKIRLFELKQQKKKAKHKGR